MLAGETMVGSNGKEDFLFPLEDMYLTQGSYTATYSHNGCYAMDFQGWSNGHRVYQCPYYAPFSCSIVAIWGSTSPMIVWQSDNEVNFVDGTTDYACIGFVHDNNTPTFHVGDHRNQGELIGHTGTYGNAAGDHVHIEAKKGTYSGYHRNSQGVYMLTGSTWLYKLIGVNDTVLTKTYYVNHNNVKVQYPWREFSDTPQPPYPPYIWTGRKKFPWVLYARKFRHRRNKM